MDGSMTDSKLEALWPRLSASARVMLCKQAELLVERYSGVMEIHCNKGGVRLLRAPYEYKPGDTDNSHSVIKTTLRLPKGL